MSSMTISQVLLRSFDPDTNSIRVMDVGGSGGGAIVNRGSYSSPHLINATLAIEADNRLRIFVQSVGGAVANPVLDNGSDTQELWLFGCSDTDTIELNSASNLVLNGKIILRNTTQIGLHWIEELAKWVEVSRNEI